MASYRGHPLQTGPGTSKPGRHPHGVEHTAAVKGPGAYVADAVPATVKQNMVSPMAVDRYVAEAAAFLKKANRDKAVTEDEFDGYVEAIDERLDSIQPETEGDISEFTPEEEAVSQKLVDAQDEIANLADKLVASRKVRKPLGAQGDKEVPLPAHLDNGPKMTEPSATTRRAGTKRNNWGKYNAAHPKR